ncbi:hypothetical protein [Sphingomonas aurantiaca]|uniref:hypothetical protein n=1 Tax=Sphingomonas aurantiaca TaxID=185949 RepID=UPI0033538BA8
MFDTHSFRSIDTGGVGTSNHAAGLMAISISRTPRDYVMLFRRNRILDINLGDETRFRLAMRLRAVSMRFYFVSASSDEAGLNAGFAGTVALRKPYAKSDLYEAVTAVLKVSNPSVLTAVSQQYAMNTAYACQRPDGIGTRFFEQSGCFFGNGAAVPLLKQPLTEG